MTDDTLSFDEAGAAGPATCSRCEAPLAEYWAVDGAVYCERCKDEVLAERQSPEGRGKRVLKALGLGLGGMLVGAAVWYAVAKLADLQIGIIAILLGWLVGKGVFFGSEKRGGLGYQLMAVLITYFGIGAAMAPFAMEEFASMARQHSDSVAAADSVPMTALSDSALDAELVAVDSAITARAAARQAAIPTGAAVAIGLVALVLGILALPILVIIGGGSLITLLIYAIALYEAWKFTRRVEPAVSGPHAVTPAAAG